MLHKLSLTHFWTCYVLVCDYVQEKCKKNHQQLSNLEIYSDQHYTNSLQQQSIVISHYADNYRWMYYDCLLLCLLSFIQCSREKNKMSIISEVTLYCIPVYCVQYIELDHLSKLMLNKKRKKKGQNTQLLSFYLVWSTSVVPHMICYQMLQYYGAEEHCDAKWGLNSRQDMENNQNRLTHNSINNSVISVKTKWSCNCNWNEHGVIVIEYNIMVV